MDTLSLTKEAKIYNGEKTISSTSGAGKTSQLHVKEWNSWQHIQTCWNSWQHTKINLKWIKNQNIRPGTVKLLEENIGRILWYKSQQTPLWPTSQSNGNKSKNKQMGLN